MKKLQIFFALLSFCAGYFFLNISEDNSQKVYTSDYLIKSLKEYKKQHSQPRPGFPGEAMKWYYEQRAYPLGYIPEGWRETALEHITKQNKKNISTDALSFTALGPGNIGGRIRSILVDPNNPAIIYIGAVAGGVWKSTNGGTSWTALKDNMENLAVCSMVMDPSNSNIIYAGTGEGYFNLDALRGAGIFKTTNGGSTWTQLSSTINSNFYYVNKLAFDASTNTLWAATRKGLFKSTNGGSSFSGVLTGTGGSDVDCTDLEIAQSSPTTIYAAFGLFSTSALYVSTNGGTTFTQSLSQSGHGRMEVAVSTSNPAVAYASLMDLSTYGTGIMAKTTDGGANWFSITVPGPSYSGADTYTGQQAWYDNILAVDPSNPNIVYAGGIDFWKSTNGGNNWTQLSNWYQESGAPPYMHADMHAVAFHPNNTNTFFVGNDGGIYKSSNGGASWTSLNNGLAITQFYYGAVHPSTSSYYGGCQDNGTIKTTGSSSWFEIFGGDGGATEVDFSTPNNVYVEYVNFCFFKSTDGGASFFKAMNGIPTGPNLYDGTTDRTQFITPFIMDPNNSSILLGGTYRIWRTTNKAVSWSAISSDLTGDGSGTSGNTISAIAVAKGNSNVIYAGTTNGRLHVTTNGGTAWNARFTGLPTATLTRIAVKPTDPATAYVTFSGFLSGQKVYRTTNYGSTWSNITSNLPNIPVNCIFINPGNEQNIYVGTDLGVFSSTDNGGTWVQETNGIPNVAIADFDYRSSDNTLFVSTHGRGMFSAVLSGGGGGGNIQVIGYDDGTPTNGYYWPGAGQGSANRITPTVSSAQVISMSIYFTAVSQGTASFIPIILQNSSGTPGNPFVTLPNTTASNVPGWNDIDLSPYTITVNDDFYVGLKYDGFNRPMFGADPANNGRAWDYDGNSWSAWSGTYFMRATIQTGTTDVTIETAIPEKFSLSANYPNPFNPSTTFRYALPNGENVKIIIYDIQGKQVAELVNNYQAPGTYTVRWNGKDDNGNPVASGTYIYSIQAGNYRESKKMLLMK